MHKAKETRTAAEGLGGGKEERFASSVPKRLEAKELKEGGGKIERFIYKSQKQKRRN